MADRAPKLTPIIARICLVILLGWLFGFALFTITLPETPPIDELPVADGIVVLTGGGGRLEAAINLLQANKGKRLLVSGVHQAVADADLANLVQAPKTLFTCCVDIDRRSSNTIDNAHATAEWVQKNQYGAIYLVTADYHMQRSQLLLGSALQGCEIKPFPVQSNMSLQGLLVEYAKLSVTWLRSLTRL